MHRKGKDIRKKRHLSALVLVPSVVGEKFSTAEFSMKLLAGKYEVSSKTNATDLLKTKRFKIESYFLQHKVSLIFR